MSFPQLRRPTLNPLAGAQPAQHYVLTADAGAETVTGTAASLLRGYSLTADAGSVTTTGTAATLLVGYRLDANAGAVTITGTAASLLRGYPLTADAGSVTLTGTAADLTVTAATAPLSYSSWRYSRGYPRAFHPSYSTRAHFATDTAYILTADAGSVAVSGTAATLLVGYRIDANAGAVTVTGTAATLLTGYRLVADAGSVTVTGTAATLTYSGGETQISQRWSDRDTTWPRHFAPSRFGQLRSRRAAPNAMVQAGTAYTLSADAGSVTVTGTAASLLWGRLLVADAGSVAVTGTDATLSKGRRLVADPGAITITGTAAALSVSRRLDAGVGAWMITGTAADLVHGGPGVDVGLAAYAIGIYDTTVTLTAVEQRKMAAQARYGG